MSQKGANLSAILFGCSQYVIFYSSSGVKEMVMLVLVVSSFYSYFKYLETKKNGYIFAVLVIILLLIFFRVPLAVFILISLLISQLLASKKNHKYIIVVFGSVISMLVLWLVSDLLFSYTKLLGRLGLIQSSKFSYSFTFTYLVAFISGILGPLPTFVPTIGNINQSMYAGSLFLKVFLSPFFIIGLFQIIRNRNKYLVPVLIFSVCEILSLIVILESFELRKAMPHMPFVIMIAIYSLETKVYKNKFTNLFIKSATVIFFIIIIVFWNSLRIFG